MSSVVSFGTNTNAQRKRVKWYNRESSAEALYEGQPVCYLFDTTTNILGYDKGTGAGSSTPTTTAEGNQNEGKFLIVEKPYTDNLQWFAGVVAHGSWCGTSVAATSYKWIEIFIPNKAIVPCRVDIDTTAAGRTIVAIEDDSQALTALGTSSNYTTRAVGIAVEDISTTGLCLVKLDPDLFICQDLSTSSALIVSTTGTGYSALNRINVINAFTAGSFCAFEIKSESGVLVNSFGTALSVTQTTTGSMLGNFSAGWIRLKISSGTPATARLSALRVEMREDDATLSSIGAPGMAILALCSDVTHAPTTGNYAWIMCEDNGAQCPSHLFQVNVKGEMGDSAAGSGGTSAATGDRMIPMRFGVDTYYLRAYADDSAN